MFKKLLICSDGSDDALHATQVAADLARHFKAEIVLLNVLDLVAAAAAAPFVAVSQTASHNDLSVRSAEDLQASIVQRTSNILAEAGVSYRRRREMGHPVEVILKAAREEQVDLIVMGSRGLSGWKALLLGSVSKGVVHHAHCPVLIVRSTQTQFKRILLASDASADAGNAAVTAAELAETLGASCRS